MGYRRRRSSFKSRLIQLKGLILLCLFLILPSCGKTAKVESGGIISYGNFPPDSDLLDYVESFKDRMTLAGQSSSRFNNLVIKFSTQPNGVLGNCSRATDPMTSIVTYTVHIGILWNQLSKAEREELVFHELGHCILDRGHLNTYTSGKPDSIMLSTNFSGVWYTDNYINYLSELFSVAPTLFAGLQFQGNIYALEADEHSSSNIEFSCSYGNESP